MALVEAWLRERLLSEPGIRSVVGQRIYPQVLPQQESLPCILYGRTGTERRYTTRRSDGIAKATLELSLQGDDYLELKTLAEAVRLGIDSFQGKVNGLAIRSVQFTAESDDYDPPQDASDKGVFIVTQIIEVTYEEQLTSELNH